MKFKLSAISAFFTACLMTACGDGGEFRVIGAVENLGTQNLRVVYYKDKALQTFTTTAIDGQFQFSGNAPSETMVEVFTTDRVPLTTLIVKNGDAVKVHLDRSVPYDWKVDGSSLSKRMAEFVKKNADVLYGGTSGDINDIVEKYVADNPADLVSAAVLLKYFNAVGHEAECDSLFGMLSESAKPDYMCEGVRNLVRDEKEYDMSVVVMPMNLYTRSDTLTVFRPDQYKRSLLTFSDDNDERREKLRVLLRGLRNDYEKTDVAIMDISMVSDTALWRKAVEHDSATWTQAWVPGAMASPSVRMLRIPRVPYYVVVDSGGSILYRGGEPDSLGVALAW